MGSTRWQEELYVSRKSLKAARGEATFDYHDKTSAKPRHERTAHTILNPHGVKVRESRDSDVHPESLAIAVLCDVTGSMRQVPHIVQDKLPTLMNLLLTKGYVDHPHIMVGGIGDATSDRVPLQISQFEAGVEIDDAITSLYLEGGGGGSRQESYELAMYFMARHTSIDCLEKRGKKGYLFFVGDEKAYDQVSPAHVKTVIDGDLGQPIPLDSMLEELQEKYEVFYILPRLTSYYELEDHHNFWRSRLGQRFILLEDPAAVCELIASQVGVCEGRVDTDGALANLDSVGSAAVKESVSKSLVKTGTTGGKLSKSSVGDSGAASGVATI